MTKVKIEHENASIQRIQERCIDCGQCLETCKSKNNLKKDDCVNCGQCILTCPMGALIPKYNYKEVMANVNDEETITAISISPAVRVAIGDEFGFELGAFLEKKLVGVLKKLGFDYVFDTTFGADLTIVEEASEFLNRIKENKNLPMFTSCCPSWVLYMEKYHPEDLNRLSTCKSPIGMQGSIIKNYFAKLKNLNPKDIVTVSLTPCVSKKSEIVNDLNNNYVITTSELCMMIREKGIDFKTIEEQDFDPTLGSGSGSGLIFGTSGGVMASALRTCYFLLNEKEPPKNFYQLKSVQGKESIKETTVDLGTYKIHVAVLYGIENVNSIYDSLKKYHFVEVMTCQNGCVGGAGQSLLPVSKQIQAVINRTKSLCENEKNKKICFSHENDEIKKVYKDFLKEPISKSAKNLLHQSYEDRSQKLKVMK